MLVCQTLADASTFLCQLLKLPEHFIFREKAQLPLHRAEVRRPPRFLRRWLDLPEPIDLAGPNSR